MLSEFELISRYFTRKPNNLRNILLGTGDDCALIAPTFGKNIAVSTDILIEGRHFFQESDPFKLGHKCLAVNLSDIAAMGARPLAFTLALSLPSVNEEWLAAFSNGLLNLADQHQCELIGGDTTRGPLSICITVFGEIMQGQALRRDNAQVGDDIWVSGTLGDARLALAVYRQELTGELTTDLTLGSDSLSTLEKRMNQPIPRIELGQSLVGIAHAAIDVSDGLVGDLGHVLKYSKVGATLEVDDLPISDILNRQKETVRHHFALEGGDEYELCFTASVEQRGSIQAMGESTRVTRVGTVDSTSGLRLRDKNNSTLDLQLTSFEHFLSL